MYERGVQPAATESPLQLLLHGCTTVEGRSQTLTRRSSDRSRLMASSGMVTRLFVGAGIASRTPEDTEAPLGRSVDSVPDHPAAFAVPQPR